MPLRNVACRPRCIPGLSIGSGSTVCAAYRGLAATNELVRGRGSDVTRTRERHPLNRVLDAVAESSDAHDEHGN